MTPEQRIEEAHGLWELEVARLAAVAEIQAEDGVRDPVLKKFVDAERVAFANWQRVSKECGA